MLNAMAFGGVEIGNGIASEQQNATASSTGEIGSTLSPMMIGMIRFAVAVLLIVDDIMHAMTPKVTEIPAVSMTAGTSPVVGCFAVMNRRKGYRSALLGGLHDFELSACNT